jgi:hypothetical protein
MQRYEVFRNNNRAEEKFIVTGLVISKKALNLSPSTGVQIWKINILIK